LNEQENCWTIFLKNNFLFGEINELFRGGGKSVRKTIYNIFRGAPKGGVDITGPKGHQSITARAAPMN